MRARRFTWPILSYSNIVAIKISVKGKKNAAVKVRGKFLGNRWEIARVYVKCRGVRYTLSLFVKSPWDIYVQCGFYFICPRVNFCFVLSSLLAVFLNVETVCCAAFSELHGLRHIIPFKCLKIFSNEFCTHASVWCVLFTVDWVKIIVVDWKQIFAQNILMLGS